MRNRLIILSLLLFSLLLTACGNPEMEGIVLEVDGEIVKVATELTPEAYEEIKDKPVTDIQNEDVSGDSYLGLMDLTYDDAAKFQAGDQVEIWIDGDIMSSYPSRATAK